MKVFKWLLILVLVMISSISNAEEIESTVKRVWREVSAYANLDIIPITITGGEPNAYVISGNSVTITTGMLQLISNEDELFAVLAHEAGHIKLNHYGAKVNNKIAISIGHIVLNGVIENNVDDYRLREHTKELVNNGSNSAIAGFSREKEVEADDFGIDLLIKANRNPVSFYILIEKITGRKGILHPSGKNTHPPDVRRLKHIRERILEKSPESYRISF